MQAMTKSFRLINTMITLYLGAKQLLLISLVRPLPWSPKVLNHFSYINNRIFESFKTQFAKTEAIFPQADIKIVHNLPFSVSSSYSLAFLSSTIAPLSTQLRTPSVPCLNSSLCPECPRTPSYITCPLKSHLFTKFQ